eukprot:jgi/Chrpa1/4505/Chrysochromulina_OHIO_Genome00013771-RA
MAPDEQEGPSQPTDPIEAYAKLVGLPTGTCPGLRFYATSLPLTIGSGAMHVQSWAHGDHCMVGQDAAVETAHLELIFEPLSLSHEVRVLGEAGVRIDGVHYGRKALVRVVSGSTVRIGAYEIAILFPHPARGTPPPPLPMPALAGAGGDAPPPMGLADLATNALRDTPGGLLTLGEVEEWARRVYPHVRASCQGPARREEWRANMMRALQARPDLVVERERHSSEHGKGLVFQLHPAVAQAHAQALAQAKALALAQEQEKQRQEQEKQRQQQAAQQALQQAQQEALLEAQQKRRLALEAAAAAAQPSAEQAQQHLSRVFFPTIAMAAIAATGAAAGSSGDIWGDGGASWSPAGQYANGPPARYPCRERILPTRRSVGGCLPCPAYQSNDAALANLTAVERSWKLDVRSAATFSECIHCLLRSGEPFMVGRPGMGAPEEVACRAMTGRTHAMDNLTLFLAGQRRVLKQLNGILTRNDEDAMSYARCYAAAINVSDVIVRV